MSSFILVPSYTEHVAMAQNPRANLERKCVIFLGRYLPVVWGSGEKLGWSEMSSSEIRIRKREIKASRTKQLHPRGHSDLCTGPLYMAVVRCCLQTAPQLCPHSRISRSPALASSWSLPSTVPLMEKLVRETNLPHCRGNITLYSWTWILNQKPDI